MDLLVQHVPVESTFALRDAMLTPGHRGRPVTADYDYVDGAIHLGLLTADGELVGCVSAEPMPFKERAGFRFHSMAVDQAYQGKGLGRRLVVSIYRELSERGASLIWATARPSAVEFYRRMGLTILDTPGAAPVTGMEVWYVVSDAAEISRVIESAS